jgi:predicted ATPase
MFGDDPGVTCLCYAAWALWFLGYPDQALNKSQEALTLAQELSHPYSLAHALSLAAISHQFRREGQATQMLVEDATALSLKHGFPFWLASGTVLLGWALTEQGNREAGIAEIREGLSAWRRMGIEVGRTYFLALLAEAYQKVGQAAEGLAVIAEALSVVSGIGRWWEAELYRLKGELLLAQSVGGIEADECFRQAIEIARRQGAKSLELRAVMSLSRLWRAQGKHVEARQLLAEIYSWFTEGFDTADLKEARALLQMLS